MKITVVLATYNGEKFLSEQLDSILNQTFQDFIILCIDDCSTDNTQNILKDYQKKFPDIIKLIFNETNLGSRLNFSKGVQLAETEFVAFSDQDDYWYPNKLEVLYQNIIKNKHLAFVYSNSELVDENLQIIKKQVIPDNNKLTGRKFYQIIIENSIMGSSMLIRTDFAKKCLPFPSQGFHHDWYLAIMALGLNYEILFVNQILFQYRLHSNNLVNQKKSKDKFAIKTYKRAKRYFDEVNNLDLSKLINKDLILLIFIKKSLFQAILNKNIFSALNHWFIFFENLKKLNIKNDKIRKSYLRYIFYSLFWKSNIGK
ncbi:MAG TPA: glycosyltransferase family 2 protein [Ignavibacteriales bacterium]|nr:glycosyltransferase family 2 protein [Ignavibacteriales bacterium]